MIEIELSGFAALSLKEQQKILDAINIQHTENEQDRLKFISLYILMATRQSAEEHNIFNVTAQFRNLLGKLLPALKIRAFEASETEELFGGVK